MQKSALSPDVQLVLQAMLADKSPEIQDFIVDVWFRDHYQQFVDHGWRYTAAVEWAMIVVHSLSEGRVPFQTGNASSWHEAQALVANFVRTKFEADKQASKDPAKDPWGPETSRLVSWWVKNMTPYSVFIVYMAMRKAALEVVDSNIQAWTIKPEAGTDTAIAANAAFNGGMMCLEQSIREALNKEIV